MGKGVEAITPFGTVRVDLSKKARHLPFKDNALSTLTIPSSSFPLSELKRTAQTLYLTSGTEPIKDEALITLQERLLGTDVPVLTAATVGNITMSRAHLSQAESYAFLFQNAGITSHVVDISQNLYEKEHKQMKGIAKNGQIIARNKVMQFVYQNATSLARSGLHLDTVFQKTIDILAAAITQTPGKPITTFHYGVGNALCNLLVKNNITTTPVIHYVTDPHHIHPDYFNYKNLPFVYYFTFDEKTSANLVEKGVPKERVFTTGFPVHPLLSLPQTNDEINERYMFEPKKKMVVSIFSGGIGSNQDEMQAIASSLDFAKQQGIFYCGTNKDIHKKVYETLSKRGAKIHSVTSEHAKYLPLHNSDEAIIISGDVLDDRLLSLSYDAINAAHVVCTKPSGDLGLECLAAHKPVIALSSWGEHEEKIKKIMQNAGALVQVKNLKTLSHLTFRELEDNALTQINPFPQDWEKRIKDALDGITKQTAGALNLN